MNRQELISYCLTYAGAYEDYPFGEEWTVMRHGGNRKGFAFIYERDGRLCVNLKCDPMRADFLRQAFRNVSPGYHMNHEHWITVALDGPDQSGSDVPDLELAGMIKHSYDLTKPKPKRGKTAARLMDIHSRLRTHYGNPHWWPGETPYEIITGAILTQNTAWGNVKKALANFGGRLSPEYVLGLEHGELAEIIRPAGFFNQKAGYLQTVTSWFRQYEYDVGTVRALPQARIREELLALRGVGRETADDILLYAFGFSSFVVDAYTMRLADRLPLPAGQDYEAVKAFFEKHLPLDTQLYNEYHALIVMNGNAHCRKKPSCGGCPLIELCAAERKAAR